MSHGAEYRSPDLGPGGGLSKPPVEFMADKSKADPAKELQQIAEQRLAYERATGGLVETVEATTLPWVLRRETRFGILQRFIGPAGYFDQYTDTHIYNMMIARAQSLKDATSSSEVQDALGLITEPWRKQSAIPRQNQAELLNDIVQTLTPEPGDTTSEKLRKSASDKLNKYFTDAEKRLPEMAAELETSASEFALSRKLTTLYWQWTQMATGQQVGDIYTQTPTWYMPRATDFAEVLSMPSEIMTHTHEGKDLNAEALPGYPSAENVSKLMEHDGLKDNEPLGEKVARGIKLRYLASISEYPEKVVLWKFKVEEKALRDILLKKGFDPEYPQQKANGIASLIPTEIKTIKESWWKDLGFKSEEEGRKYIGYPEMWVPFKARRGVETTKGVLGANDRQARIDTIAGELGKLRDLYVKLSPLSNPKWNDVVSLKPEVEAITNKIRDLSIIKNSKGETENLFFSLYLERHLGMPNPTTKEFIPLRGVKDRSVVWYGDLPAKPQMFGEKEAAEANVLKILGGDKLAGEMSSIIHTLWGFKSKYGYYARDFNPLEPDVNKQWKVDVEGFPYSDEMANALAFSWWQIYKGTAAGPNGSRGRFGQIMTDYLDYNVILPEKTTIVVNRVPTEVLLRDEAGRELLKIIDDKGQIRPGRPDEGVVIGDYEISLQNLLESGADLSDKSLWKGTLEDPYRRYLLRGFFAEGRTFNGSDLKTILTKTDWKPEQLLDDGFWEGFKLALKVGLRKEQLEEESGNAFYGLPVNEGGWIRVVNQEGNLNKDGLNIHEEFQGKVLELINKLTDPQLTPTQRQKLIQDNASLYSDYQKRAKEIIDNYIYKTWWKGIQSLPLYTSWESELIPEGKPLGMENIPGQGKAKASDYMKAGFKMQAYGDLAGKPMQRYIIDRILEIAKRHGVDLEEK